MKLILHTELRTENVRNLRRGRITMFSKNIIIPDISSANFITLMEDGYLQIEDLILRPNNFCPHESDIYTCEGFACTHILHRQDSLQYYQDLISKDWIPNIDCAKAIQSDGYTNFEPWKF